MEEMKDMECPVCGSYNITISYNEDIAQAAFGTVVPFKEKVIKCNACESTFSDDNISENPYSKALEQSKKESIGLILGSLLEMGYTLASMERALELPQRTMSQWKSGRDLSAAGIALLRIIKTYPWIIEVADAKYDYTKAGDILILNALTKMHENVKQKGCQLQDIKSYPTDTGFSINIDFMNNEGTISNNPWLKNEKETVMGKITYNIK